MAQQNRTVIDYRFIACATCQFWQGKAEYNFPGTVIINQNEDTMGKCNSTYYGAKTQAFMSCKNWKQRYE